MLSRSPALRRTASIFVLSAVAAVVGCSDPRTESEWRQFGLTYSNFVLTYRKGPATLADLEYDRSKFPEMAKKIESGDIIVRWGANNGWDPGGELYKEGATANYVLVYEKDAAENGGRVLVGIGSYRDVSADEFKELELFPIEKRATSQNDAAPAAQSEISVEEAP